MLPQEIASSLKKSEGTNDSPIMLQTTIGSTKVNFRSIQAKSTKKVAPKGGKINRDSAIKYTDFVQLQRAAKNIIANQATRSLKNNIDTPIAQVKIDQHLSFQGRDRQVTDDEQVREILKKLTILNLRDRYEKIFTSSLSNLNPGQQEKLMNKITEFQQSLVDVMLSSKNQRSSFILVLANKLNNNKIFFTAI